MRDYKTILNRKLHDLFPDEACRSKTVDILACYGAGLHGREPKRTRLAILKLSGTNLDKLERNT